MTYKCAVVIALICLATTSLAGQFKDLDRRLRGLQDSDVIATLKVAPKTHQILEIKTLLEVAETGEMPSEDQIDQAKGAIHLRALTEESPTNVDTKAKIKAIKASPVYNDEVHGQSNWLSKAIQRLLDMLPKLNQNKNADMSGLAHLGSWLTYLMWAVLAAAVAFFGYFAVKHFSWRAKLKRASKALLEEDEPERTKDEWLAQADALAAQGKHREAVRCLYLACLLRFDEAKIARFDRGQTNWEHFERIQKSSKLPQDIDFSAPTRAFDLIWYGFQVKGESDTEQFRAWYQEISRKLESGVAA